MAEAVDYLKIGKGSDLTGRDYKIYRLLEMFPGFFSVGTLVILSVLSYFRPIWVAYFLIAFDVYWLLLVLYMAVFLITSYRELQRGLKTDWRAKCEELPALIRTAGASFPADCLVKNGLTWQEVSHLIVLPAYKESVEVISDCLNGLLADGFPPEKMIVALTLEERGGKEEAEERAAVIRASFGDKFGRFLVTIHPDNLPGELRVKGANQAWAARIAKRDIIDKEGMDHNRLVVSVFDIDTVVKPGYFFALTYKFLTVSDPYHTSYQPVPVYHNNIWNAPFFSRIVASSNTFWQMIMQIRRESLVTYSSHSMTFRALVEIDFWSPTNVSEDSRIFWHCLMYYNGHYKVEPVHFEVSMDVTTDQNLWRTARNLYKQQRRWAWGGENIPYLIFNSAKRWHNPGIDKKGILNHIMIQVYGFHAWATSALIIAVIGWLPMLIGGDRFNSTVLSGNLPFVTQSLMNVAMVGLILSAVVSALLLPPRPKKYGLWKNIVMVLEWVAVPATIVIFGAVPCLEAQIRLLLGKYMGFWVTPKIRRPENK
jgi:cellulose synthase/poly-beta-1,6-N-acetylglucosamine synthase-like glycosyltransferase